MTVHSGPLFRSSSYPVQWRGPAHASGVGRVHVTPSIDASIVTALGLAEDLKKGLIDRFRSLPMSQSSVLTGRTLTDLLRAHGVQVQVLQDPDCIELMARFIRERPELWDEDIAGRTSV